MNDKEKKIIIDQIKKDLSKLCPENNMQFVFNIPGGCSDSVFLEKRIKAEVTEVF